MGHERRAETEPSGRGPGWVLLGLLPLLGLGVLLAFIVLNGAGIERKDVPPVEDLTVTRVACPRSMSSWCTSVTADRIR
jgi:hypothetical protein